MSNLSNHARKRIKQRIGTRRMEQLFDKALTDGIPQSETKGDLKRFLAKGAMAHQTNCIVYKGFIFWHNKANVLITVTPLPQKFIKYVKEKH